MTDAVDDDVLAGHGGWPGLLTELLAGRDLSAEQARLRPVTPGYPVASEVFLKALMDIANGADPADTLDAAADEINADIESNQGYGQSQ